MLFRSKSESQKAYCNYRIDSLCLRFPIFTTLPQRQDTLNFNQIWLGLAPPSTGQACTLTLKLLFATALFVSKTNTCHTRSRVTSPKLLFSDPKYTKPLCSPNSLKSPKPSIVPKTSQTLLPTSPPLDSISHYQINLTVRKTTHIYNHQPLPHYQNIDCKKTKSNGNNMGLYNNVLIKSKENRV